MSVIAFIGFGELGAALARGLSRSGSHELRAYARDPASAPMATALAERLRAAGVRRCATTAEAVADAHAVLSVVPGTASLTVAESCAPLLAPEACFVDLSAGPVADKVAGAELIAATGGHYVDGAVLGTVRASGSAVPILASGPGAARWAALIADDQLRVEVIEAPVGHASLVKLLRSVYMKGRDALIVETMLAARRHGLDERVAASIQGPGEQVSFAALAERVMCALAVHAERRADELEASSEVVRATGVEPRLSRAGTAVLRAVAALELEDLFDDEHPPDAHRVLGAIDERTRAAPRSSDDRQCAELQLADEDA